MKIRIMTGRAYYKEPYWDVVHEWEDDMSEVFGALVDDFHSGIKGVINRIYLPVKRKLSKKQEYFKLTGNSCDFTWIMDAKNYKLYTRPGVVPVFLDFNTNMVDEIFVATRTLPFFWVTSYDIYSIFKEKGARNVYWMPLCISNRYISEGVHDKDIDVIQLGRKNNKLHEYMLRYCKSHPEIQYVYQSEDGSLTYITTKGDNLGRFDKRSKYMEMLGRCKISLVSTPGCDNSRNWGGIDFFTPRFYESAAMYCHMIGRYTDNKEAEQIGVKMICSNIDGYEMFEEQINKCLSIDNKVCVDAYKEFLYSNCTKVRFQEMKELVCHEIDTVYRFKERN